LGLFVAQAHPQPGPFGSDRQVLISEPADQVEGLLHRLLLGLAQGVGLNVLLDGCPHLGCRAEVAVRRHQTTEPLVRPLEVVALDEERQSSLTVGEVRKHRATEKLVPQGLPEALDLSQGLGMLRPALDVTDSVLPQPLLEERLAPPGRVLSSLIRQDFLGCAEGRDPSLQRLQDQRALLVVRQDEAHEKPRVVVHEGRQVQPLVASQEKREDVRLPQLIRCRPLEAPWRPRATVLRPGRRRRRHPGLLQHPPHRRLRHAQGLEALDHVADSPRSVLRVFLLERCHRRDDWIIPVQRAGLAACRLRHQRLFAAQLVGHQPVSDRHLRDVERPRHQTQRCLPLDDLPYDLTPHLERVNP
jgi:hypothetical protein